MAAETGHTPSLTATVSIHDTVTVLRVAGVVDLATATRLEEAIDDALGSGNSPSGAALSGFVIDLTDVEFLASVGMAILVATQQRLTDVARFAIVADGPATARPLALTGLDRVLSIHPTLAAALAG